MPEKITVCPTCQAPISTEAEWCPRCGRKAPSYDFVLVDNQAMLEEERDPREAPEGYVFAEPNHDPPPPFPSPLRDAKFRRLMGWLIFGGLVILVLLFFYLFPN